MIAATHIAAWLIILKNYEISGKSQNFIELLSSA